MCSNKATASPLKGVWVPHDTRDQIVDYINYWTEQSELPASRLLGWLELGSSKFHDWKQRYGKVNEHNGKIPRDHWLEDWEQKAILDSHDRHPLEGYRRLTFMMLDDDPLPFQGVLPAHSQPVSVLSVGSWPDRVHARQSKRREPKSCLT